MQWICTGMLIELEQYVTIGFKGLISLLHIIRYALQSEIHGLRRSSPTKDQTWIQDKRELLQAKIEAFHSQAPQFIQLDTAPTTTQAQLEKSFDNLGLNLEESDEEALFLDDELGWEEGDRETPIEQVKLWLPSSFTKLERVQMGIERIATVEIELWEGQANDALEALRASLAEKSLRFRTEVKPAKSQKTMTRAWDSIHKADKQIRDAVHHYQLARSALGELGAPRELLSQYQGIQKKDLKMSRDIVEENRVGQRSSELPWFWRLDGKWDNDRGEFVKECKYYYLFSCYTGGNSLQFTG